VFSTVAFDGHEWSTLCSDRLTPAKITLDIQWKEDYMFSTAKRNAGKKKISFRYLKWTADSSVVQPSAELSYKLTLKISSPGSHSEAEAGIKLLNFCSQIK
jgi:hypothetical protein